MRNAYRIREAGLTFDVGGTLIEPWPSVGHIYSEVAANLGCGSFAAAELNRRFVQAWKTKASFDYSRDAWSSLVAHTFAEFVPLSDIPRLFEALYDRFRAPDAWHIHEDAIPTLTALRSKGCKLGIISNWDERLDPLLRELGLDKFFDALVISHDVGATKPAAQIFAVAAARLGLPPSAILHVGDSVNEDYEGARRAGFKAVLLDRDEDAGDGRIRALRELLPP